MKGFIYSMLALAAIVFLYQHGFAIPDLGTSFGELGAAYNNAVYHTPLGDISAGGEAQRYEAAAGLAVPTAQNPYPASSNISSGYVLPRN